MQFSTALVGAAVFAIANAAKFTMPGSFFTNVPAGRGANITWNEASGPVTLLLKNGVSTNLQTVATIATGLTGNSYVWTPDTNLVAGTYALEITDSSGPNYSLQFPISGATGTASASASSTTGSSSANSTSTASSSSTTSAGNSTVTTTGTRSTTSATRTGTTTSSTSTSTTIPNSMGNSIASPLALVFLAVAALMTLQ